MPTTRHPFISKGPVVFLGELAAAFALRLSKKPASLSGTHDAMGSAARSTSQPFRCELLGIHENSWIDILPAGPRHGHRDHDAAVLAHEKHRHVPFVDPRPIFSRDRTDQSWLRL